MIINFTVFNSGQEHYSFNTSSLKEGEELVKFIVHKDKKDIHIMPMIKDKGMYYAGDILERITE